jgi:S-adenosylmethionine decarboxylase
VRNQSLAAGTGVEWFVDARGCDPARLTSPATLAALFDEIIADLDLHVVATPVWHKFPGHGGVTGIALLAESHLAVHSFPEHRSLCLNLFCCRPRAEWDFAGRLAAHVGAAEVDVRRVDRSYADVASPVALTT